MAVSRDWSLGRGSSPYREAETDRIHTMTLSEDWLAEKKEELLATLLAELWYQSLHYIQPLGDISESICFAGVTHKHRAGW